MLGALPPRDYDPETRDLLNAALRSLLSHYGHPFDIILHILQTDTDPVELMQLAPVIVDVLEAGGHLKKGTFSKNRAILLQELIGLLVEMFVQAANGNELADKHIQVVNKLLDPGRFGGVPLTVVEELLEKYHTRPALARGWSIRVLMGKLSWGVQPGKPGRNVLEGKVKLTSSEHMRNETTYWHEYDKWMSAYDVAVDHWPKRGAPTLKSLAVKVYLRQLHKEGFTNISEASLEGDLQQLAEWEKMHPKETEQSSQLLIFNLGGKNLSLPRQDFSEGWKQSGHYEQNKPPEKVRKNNMSKNPK